jgi:arylsulfatase A-like enzyme
MSTKLVIALLIALLIGTTIVAYHPSDKRRFHSSAKHIVLVVFDTLRADRMSLYGHTRKTTPFLESIRNELVVFENAKAAAPWTIPSHASIFTGLLPAQHRAQWGRAFLSEKHQTLAETLRQEDFLTAAFIANPFLADKKTGFGQGFDIYRSPKNKQYFKKSTTILRELTKAIDLAEKYDRRLFLFLNFMDNHIPYNTKKYGKQYGAVASGPINTAEIKWQINSGQRPFKPAEKIAHQAAYDASVRYIDDVAKKLLTILKERKLLEDTLLIITSDHGDGLGFHQEIGHCLSVWEEQLAVPLLLRFPSAQFGNTRIQRTTSLASITPSILDWTGITKPKHLRGMSTIDSPDGSLVTADYRSYFSETKRNYNSGVADKFPGLRQRTAHSHVLYCDNHKIIQDSKGQLNIYNLLTDPTEQFSIDNRTNDDMKKCLWHYSQLEREQAFTPFSESLSSKERREAKERANLEALRSLGYMQ